MSDYLSPPQACRALRQALIDRADDLFRQAWGEPDRPAARQWRAKASTARSMEMAGAKRGLWHDHKAGIGGDVLDFFAVEFCGLSRARDDFGRVVDEASRWCGLSLDQAPDLSALTARAQARRAAQAVEAATDARRVQTLVETMQARAQPLDGTPAATYLASRGIDALPAGWSYLPAVPGAGEHDALVAWATDDQGRIKGGQRILVLPDGTRPNTKVVKPAFGSVGGYPARIPATIEGAPLVICEGPETAASVAEATGFEVWAVFGVSGFATAPAPVDRQVIFCPDRDAIKSPAAVAFERACIVQAARGVDLHIAQAPEPAGSKSDLNDTLLRAGADAVVAAIDAAARFLSSAAPDIPALRPTLPIPTDLPSGRRTDLQAALEACGDAGGGDPVAVALAVALKLERKVPVALSLEDVRAFLEAHLPPGLVPPMTIDAVIERVRTRQARRKFAALVHVRLPGDVRQRHDHVEVEALAPETIKGVVVVRAPMGKGKTQIVGRPFVEWAKSQGGGILAICHRMTLVSEIGQRLDLPDYRTAIVEEIRAAAGVAVCLPSITKAEIMEAMPSPRFVFIDEIAQVLRFFSAKDFCRTRNADPAEVFAYLVRIVRGAEAVLVADAGADARTMWFLEMCRPGERFRVIEMQPQDTDKSAVVMTGPSKVLRDDLARIVLAELAAGGKVWCATEGADHAAALEFYFAQLGYEAISITAANKDKDRQAAFLRHPDSVSRLYDVVIASPAISSGISIEHRNNPHFTLVTYCGSGGATTPADAMQQINRVRYATRFVAAIEANNLTGGQRGQDEIAGRIEAARIEGAQVAVTAFDEMVADINATTTNAGADFGAGLWWMMEAERWTLTRHIREDQGAGDGPTVRDVRKAMTETRRAGLIASEPIDSGTADLLKSRPRTEADEMRLEGWRIRQAFGSIEIDEAMIDQWDNGRGAACLDRFDDLLMVSGVRVDGADCVLVHRDMRAARALLYAELLEGFDWTRPDCLGPEAMRTIVDRVMERPDVFVAVKIVPPKYGARFTGKGGRVLPPVRPKQPIRLVRDILERVGLKLVQKRARCPKTCFRSINTKGVLGQDTAQDTPDNRAYIGGTCVVALARMQAISARRQDFDLDDLIAQRHLDDLPEHEGTPTDDPPDTADKPIGQVVNVVEEIFWKRAERNARVANISRGGTMYRTANLQTDDEPHLPLSEQAKAQPAQVHVLHSPGYHEAHRRHRAKADSRGRTALAVDHRIEATGFWIAFHLRELIRALHVTKDHERIAGLLGWPLARVKNNMTVLYVLGLVAADGALDGPLALRKLVRATGIDSPIMAAFIETRQQPKRMHA